jgi:hypothetical protein
MVKKSYVVGTYHPDPDKYPSDPVVYSNERLDNIDSVGFPAAVEHGDCMNIGSMFIANDWNRSARNLNEAYEYLDTHEGKFGEVIQTVKGMDNRRYALFELHGSALPACIKNGKYKEISLASEENRQKNKDFTYDISFVEKAARPDCHVVSDIFKTKEEAVNYMRNHVYRPYEPEYINSMSDTDAQKTATVNFLSILKENEVAESVAKKLVDYYNDVNSKGRDAITERDQKIEALSAELEEKQKTESQNKRDASLMEKTYAETIANIDNSDINGIFDELAKNDSSGVVGALLGPKKLSDASGPVEKMNACATIIACSSRVKRRRHDDAVSSFVPTEVAVTTTPITNNNPFPEPISLTDAYTKNYSADYVLKSKLGF